MQKLKLTKLMKKIILFLLLSLGSCKSNVIMAPKDSVAVRSQLDRDGFGGYITLMSKGEYIQGELIGVRNDSVVVLTESSVVSSSVDQITYGQLIAHHPNNYVGLGIIPMVPNAIMMTIGGYGGGPVILGLLFSGINALGIGAAMGTENLKSNFFDWSDEKAEVLKYSRFPGGIPDQVVLGELRSRPKPVDKRTGRR